MAQNQNWIKYSNLGFQIIATLCVFGGIGYYIDSKYNYESVFLIIGLLLGCFIAMYGLWVSIFK
tara:strand:+ start:43 stop:234 length:192 start_codon:yes stop_codon:yes gene_type:complete